MQSPETDPAGADRGGRPPRATDPVTLAALLGSAVACGAWLGVVEGAAVGVLGWAALSPPRRWRRADDHARLIAGCLAGLGVALIALEAARQMTRWYRHAELTMMRGIARQLEAYVDEFGALPSAEEQARLIDRDSWDRPYQLERLPTGRVRVTTLGADGRVGGHGNDEDLSATGERDPPDAPLIARQDFQHHPAFLSGLVEATLSGLVACVLVFAAGEPRNYGHPVGQRVGLAVAVGLVLWGASGLATLMVAAAAPSGH